MHGSANSKMNKEVKSDSKPASIVPLLVGGNFVYDHISLTCRKPELFVLYVFAMIGSSV